MPDLEELRSALRDRESEPRVKRMWDRIDRARGAHGAPPTLVFSRRAPMAAFALVAVAAGLALAAYVAPPGAPEALVRTDGAPLAGALPAAATVELSDGSRIEPEDGARLDVLESSGRTVSLGLRHGRARFVVTPGGPRAWHVECGDVTVDVVGTIFTVDRDGARVSVEVERGSVLVRGDGVPDHAQRIDAGGSIDIGPPPEPEEDTLAPTIALVEPATVPTLEPSPPLRRGAEEPEDPVGDLLTRADDARREGDDAPAARLLDSIVTRHADDPRAALAAYTLGRLRLDRMGELHGAARSFARAIELGLPDELAEGARAGRAIALARAHDPAAADALADYLDAHPDGRSRAEVLRASEAP